MKKILFIFSMCLLLLFINVKASLPLSLKTIIIDVGHGGKDVGTTYKNIYEKDINLEIAKVLEQELIKNGASVILLRDNDFDLSSPNSKRRKKSDFDNRILLINNSSSDLYLSIHLNYYNNPKYSGAQVFYNKTYKENKILANIIQNNLNKDRKIKKLDEKLYMYNKLNKKGVLIECGFLSNYRDRTNLQDINYIKKVSKLIAKSLIEFYSQ